MKRVTETDVIDECLAYMHRAIRSKEDISALHKACMVGASQTFGRDRSFLLTVAEICDIGKI